MAFFGSLGVLLLAIAAGVYAVSGGAGRAWFVPADTLATLVAVSGLLSFATGGLASVMGRRFQEVEAKVDMATVEGLLRDDISD